MEEFCGTQKKILKTKNFHTKSMISLILEKLESYLNSKIFNICDKKFNKHVTEYRNMRDHCHFTGKYQETAY